MSSKIRLNDSEVLDVEEIYNRYPDICTSRDAFLSILLSNVPEVKQNKVPASETLRGLIRDYYVTFLYDHYNWFKMIGLHPYYFERWKDPNHPDDVHYIPRTPAWRSGYINTYLDSKGQQQFEWVPMIEFKKRVYFFRCPNHTPLLNGSLCSSIASLIPDWKTKKIVRESTELVSYQQARPQHVFEYHPAKESNASKNAESWTATTYAEQQNGERAHRNTAERTYSMQVPLHGLMNAIKQRDAINNGWKRRLGASNVINSEGMDEQWERENSGLIARGIPLFEHFVYKPVPTPSVTANYEFLCRRLDTQVASVMDFPIQSIDAKHTKNTTATMAGNMRYINDRVNSWRFVFEDTIRFIFKSIYEMECDVEILTTPIARLEDLKVLYDDELWGKEDYADHAFKILGIHKNKVKK